jgi:uncharacterized membrane protein
MNGVITDLSTLGSATGAVANSINDQGRIVGGSGGRAVMFTSSRRSGSVCCDAPAWACAPSAPIAPSVSEPC